MKLAREPAQPLAPGGRPGLSPMDTQLLVLSAQGRSPREIGAEMNLPPEQVVLRVRAILDGRSTWSEQDRFMMFLDELYDLKEYLQADISRTHDPKSVANLIRVFEQIAKALDKATAASQAVQDRISDQQARFLLGLIVAAFGHAKEQLSADYPDLPWVVIDGAFQEGLQHAVEA